MSSAYMLYCCQHPYQHIEWYKFTNGARVGPRSASSLIPIFPVQRQGASQNLRSNLRAGGSLASRHEGRDSIRVVRVHERKTNTPTLPQRRTTSPLQHEKTAPPPRGPALRRVLLSIVTNVAHRVKPRGSSAAWSCAWNCGSTSADHT